MKCVKLKQMQGGTLAQVLKNVADTVINPARFRGRPGRMS